MDLTNNENLIEVYPNIWLNKSDPDFLKKYLKYNPKDKETLFQYGIKMIEEGKIVDGIQHLEKAKSLGHIASRDFLNKLNKPTTYPSREKIQKRTDSATGLLPLFLFPLLLLFFLLLAFLTFHFISNQFFYEENEYYYEKNEHYASANDNPNEPYAKKTTKDELEELVVFNAIERYKETSGNPPKILKELVTKKKAEGKPISLLPSQPTDYENSPMSISFGSTTFSGSVPDSHLLELHFFPFENKLSLVRGNGETLSVYPVASGKDLLPFKETTVSFRVTNPNGGGGILGTRGLVLEDNFALHGTNTPSSIGKDVTMGCVRMLNEDIEELYPYVSVGTPLIVKPGGPGIPTFSKGLPTIHLSPSVIEEEQTPQVKYNWKN